MISFAHTFLLDVNLDFFVYTARTLFLNGEKMLINCFECEDKKKLCAVAASRSDVEDKQDHPFETISTSHPAPP